MRRYFDLGILCLAVLSGFVDRAEAYCTDDGAYYSLKLDDPSNPSDYNLTMTLHWNVTEGAANITGFLYRLSDKDGSLSRKKRFDDSFLGPPPPLTTASCQGVNDLIWTTLENGTSVQCNIPCEGILPPPPEFGSLCPHLQHGNYVSISKESRSIVLPIRFGRSYDFEMFAYNRWNVVSQCTTDLRRLAVFCRHELVTNHAVKTDVADDFCRQEQILGRNSHTTGLVSNFSLVRTYRDMRINRGAAVFRWRDPHDVFSNVTIERYEINVIENGKPDKDKVHYSEEIDGFYSLTVRNVVFGKRSIVIITPITNISYCELCTDYGAQWWEEFLVPDIDACVGDNITERYCDPIARCVDHDQHSGIAATCNCTEGYAGNGINGSFEGGTGCRDFDSCSSMGARNDTCVPEADCSDEPPPNLGVRCSCPANYIGDGYRSGFGCREQSLLIGLVVGIPAVVLLIVAAVLLVRRRRRARKRKFEMEASHYLNGNVIYNTPASQNGNFAPTRTDDGLFGRKWELDRSRLELKGVIGRGNFGVVQRATLKTDDECEIVAVKMIPEIPSESLRQAFLSEISTITTLGSHPNLIGMIGCCTVADGPILMVSEYMKYGDLLHFLWNAREQKCRENDLIYNLTEWDVYLIASQIACGMRYLRKIRVIHGDLAARNVLVGESLVCKISDFGLANDVYRYGAIRGATEKTVPLKWVSPERMMNGRVPITWRSDVWSFGILLYEAITLGGVPYPNIGGDEIFEKLKSGYRMTKPDSCTQYLYNIISKCWEWTPSKRPNFKKLEEDLKSPFANAHKDSYVRLTTVVPSLENGNDPSTPAHDNTVSNRQAVDERDASAHNGISLTVSNERAVDERDDSEHKISLTVSNDCSSERQC